MNKRIKKLVAAIVASAMCVIGSMSSLSATAYTVADSWSLFKVNNPHVPGQVWSDTCYIPAYSGGYIVCCDSFVGASDACLVVTTNFGYTFYFTSPGCSDVIFSSAGGTAVFTFNLIGDSPISASGSLGYNI